MKNILFRTIDIILKNEGFVRKSDSWYRDAEDAILVCNLQKSQYGEQYYVNLAVWLKALGEAAFPKENSCHIRVRLNALSPDDAKNLFDLERSEIADSDREQGVSRVFKQFGLPLFARCSSHRDLENLIESDEMKKAMVHRRVRELIELTQ